MIRIRYLYLSTDATVTEILSSLQTLTYSDERGYGFNIDELARNECTGSYIQRQVIEEQIVLPNGDIEANNRTIISSFAFKLWGINKKNLIVKVLNSPQSLKHFINALDKNDARLSVSRITFDTVDTYQWFVKLPNVSRHSVTRVLATQVPFSQKSVASIDLKAEHNALDELKAKHDLDLVKISKLYLTLRYAGENESICISSSGSISLTTGLTESLDKFVQKKVEKEI